MEIWSACGCWRLALLAPSYPRQVKRVISRSLLAVTLPSLSYELVLFSYKHKFLLLHCFQTHHYRRYRFTFSFTMPRSKRTARKKAATKKAPPPSGRARKVMRHREMQDLGPSPPLYTPGPDDTIRKPDYGGDIVPLSAALPRMPPAHTGETGKLLKPVPPAKTKKRDGAYILPFHELASRTSGQDPN